MTATHQPTPSDYSIWLVAQKLKELILEAGGRCERFEVTFGKKSGMFTSEEPAYWASNISIHTDDAASSTEEREGTVARMLETIPGAQLYRSNGNMTVYGMWSTGVTYYLWGGTGSCERVQVGTRKVMKPAPDAGRAVMTRMPGDDAADEIERLRGEVEWDHRGIPIYEDGSEAVGRSIDACRELVEADANPDHWINKERNYDLPAFVAFRTERRRRGTDGPWEPTPEGESA